MGLHYNIEFHNNVFVIVVLNEEKEIIDHIVLTEHELELVKKSGEICIYK